MDWFLLVMLSSLSYSVSTILQRVLLKKEDSNPTAYSIAFQIMTGFVIFLFALYTGLSFAGMEKFLPNIFLMVFMYAAANTAYFRALKLSEVSEVSVINSSRSLWNALGAAVVLGEVITQSILVGTVLVVAGVIIVSYKTRKLKFSKGHMLALLSSFLYGFGFVNDAFVIKSVSVPTYAFLSYLMPAAALIIVRTESIKHLKKFFASKEKLSRMAVISVLSAASSILLYLAVSIGTASQIYPIRQTYIVFIVILAAIFLKERSNLGRKFIGALLVIAGAILLR